MGVKILTWFVLSYGLMNIVVFSSIFSGVRNFFSGMSQSSIGLFKEFGSFISGIVTCPMCFGFHGGWFLSLSVFSPINALFNVPVEFSWFFDGVLSSGAVWAINAMVEWFEENRK